jgi:predicted secreted protein
MNWVEGVVVYVITWWLVIFCVLPIGVKRAEEEHLGHDAGAPANPRLKFKALLTTGITTVIFIAIYWVVSSPYLSFRGD